MVHAMGYEIHESYDEIVLAFDGVTVSGHLQLPSHQHTADFCARAAAKSRGAVIDFQRKSCLSDRTAAWLIQLLSASRSRAFHLRIANISPDDRKVIELLKLDRVLPIDDDRSGEGGAVVLHPKPNGPSSGRAMPPQE